MRLRRCSTSSDATSLDFHTDSIHLIASGLRDALVVLDVVDDAGNQRWSLGDCHAIDLVLKPHEPVQKRFGAGRTTGNVYVNRDYVIDTLQNGIRIERS